MFIRKSTNIVVVFLSLLMMFIPEDDYHNIKKNHINWVVLVMMHYQQQLVQWVSRVQSS